VLVLTDERWAALEPLVAACRPPAKVPPRHLRRTISAILWRHENGAKWRAVPGEFGPWWMAAQTFIRWARLGVWERLLDLVQQRGVALGMVFLDGTNVRAHQKAAGAERMGADAEERDRREALGRSRGGYGTKACVVADGRGRAVAFALAPGQAHELPMAPGLLDCLPDVPGWVVGDRGLASDAFRDLIWNMGARPAIPPKRTDAPVACPPWIYANRRLVENLWARLKEWRAVATRYEKTARSFLGVLSLAATCDWLKS
jgi:transposase